MQKTPSFIFEQNKFSNKNQELEMRNSIVISCWKTWNWLKRIQDKNNVAYFWLLLFAADSAAKSNEKLVSQKLCNTYLIFDAL